MTSLEGLGLCLPSLLRYVFFLLSFLFSHSSSASLYISNIQSKHLYLASPAVGALIDLPHLLWSVYAYGPNGFSREQPMSLNTNLVNCSGARGARLTC